MRQGKRIGSREGADRPTRRLRPDDDLDWEVVKKELLERFNSRRGARAALARLVAARCDEMAICQNLYLFCGGDPRAMQALRDDLGFDRRKKTMLRIAKLLEDASSEIEVAEQLLTDLGISHNMKPDVSSLVSYAGLLKRVGDVAYSKLAYKRISGRDQHLVYLSRMIVARTGKPHYRELADLVTSTRLLYDPNAPERETEDSIRKRISNYGLIDLGSELELIEMGYLLPKLRRKSQSH